MRVKLLDMTPDAENILYAAARQCYNEGWVGDHVNGHYPGTFSKKPLKGDKPSQKEINENSVSIENKVKLIDHILKSGHHSVLEHVKFTFLVDGISRACSHQLVRHRIASYSQQSQRYAGKGDTGNEGLGKYIIPTKIKQDPKLLATFEKFIKNVEETYDFLVAEGIKEEDARMVLPNACPTRIVITMNARALIHFFAERCCTRAQKEIRDMANLMLDLCRERMPFVYENIGPKCYDLEFCPEQSGSCGLRPSKKDLLDAYNAAR